MRAKDEDWREESLRVGKESLKRAAFHLTYAHSLSTEQVEEIARRGGEEGTAARNEFGPPKAMSDEVEG